MTEILIAVIGVVSTTAGSWLSWFLARKKYNSEVDNNVISNMEASLEFYQKLSTDNKERLDSALQENKELRVEIASLQEDNINLRKEIEDLKSAVIQLTTQICTDLTCQLRVMGQPKNDKNDENDKDKNKNKTV